MGAETTFIVTGDAFMTRRLPEGGYKGFEELKNVIMTHDVRFNNLEITVHNKEGYPAAFSGGTWAMASPKILDDLQKFGFNLYNTANNHSCDYSHGGLIATAKYLKERGLLFAGTGENLFEASAAAYLETVNARVALIGACSSFHDSDIAGNQSQSMQGRPGLNPLRYKTTFHVEKDYYDALQNITHETDINASWNLTVKNGYALAPPEGKLYFGGLSFECSDENKTLTEPLKKDVDRITASIKEARQQADYVLVSIHTHEFSGDNIREPAEFIKEFCHNCIDAGADAVLGHGPHELRGIEIYKGKVIFYSLGNFIFQTETVGLQPADAYENAMMPHNTMVSEYMNQRSKKGTSGYSVQPNIWSSIMAGFTAKDGKITEIILYPITLNMDFPRSRIGFPCLLHGNEVLEYLEKLSAPYGTKFVIKNGIATIKV